MSDLSERLEEKIKFYEIQKAQAKEVYIKAIGFIEGAKEVLENKKDSK